MYVFLYMCTCVYIMFVYNICVYLYFMYGSENKQCVVCVSLYLCVLQMVVCMFTYEYVFACVIVNLSLYLCVFV